MIIFIDSVFWKWINLLCNMFVVWRILLYWWYIIGLIFSLNFALYLYACIEENVCLLNFVLCLEWFKRCMWVLIVDEFICVVYLILMVFKLLVIITRSVFGVWRGIRILRVRDFWEGGLIIFCVLCICELYVIFVCMRILYDLLINFNEVFVDVTYRVRASSNLIFFVWSCFIFCLIVWVKLCRVLLFVVWMVLILIFVVVLYWMVYVVVKMLYVVYDFKSFIVRFWLGMYGCRVN